MERKESAQVFLWQLNGRAFNVAENEGRKSGVTEPRCERVNRSMVSDDRFINFHLFDDESAAGRRRLPVLFHNFFDRPNEQPVRHHLLLLEVELLLVHRLLVLLRERFFDEVFAERQNGGGF